MLHLLENDNFLTFVTTCFSIIILYNGIRKTNKDIGTYLFIILSVIWIILMAWRILY